MKDKVFFSIIVALLLGLLISQYYLIKNRKPSSEEILIEKIVEIESKLDSISTKKDSIRTVIITVDKEILTNEKHYETVVHNIVNQSHTADSVFANDYIKRFIDQRTR